MVLGLGIDIIEIHRIEKALDNPAFLDRVYTHKEQEYLKTRGYNPGTAAGYFAAKEAGAKALGTGFGKVRWTDIEIIKDEAGKPGIILYGEGKRRMEDMGGQAIHLSISHSKRDAIAQVIIS